MLHLSRHGLISIALLSAAALVLPGLQAAPGGPAQPDPVSPHPEGDSERWADLARKAQDLRTWMNTDAATPEATTVELRKLLAEANLYTLDNPDDYRAWNLIANLCGQLQDDQGVDRAARNLLRMQPGNVQAGLQWMVHYAQTDPAKALEICEYLLEGKPTSLMYLNAWIVTQRLIDPGRIETRFTELASDPATLDQAIAFTRALQQSDSWSAVPLGERLMELAPTNVKAVDAAARAYRFSNQFSKAREVLSRLPDETLAQPQLAYLYSDCHYADHDFQRAYEIMAAIDLDAIEDQPSLVRRLKFMLPLRETAIESWAQEQAIRAEDAKQDNLPRVRLVIDGKPVIVELFPNEAPTTVAAFLALARRGDFDDTPFGQVQTGFRSIGGTIPGRVPYSLPGEFSREDARHFFSGTLAMYLPRAGNPDSANCEWCIYHFPAPHLNGERTVFGRVVTGLDDVRAMREGRAHLNKVEILRDFDPGMTNFDPDPDVIDMEGRTRKLGVVLAEADAKAATTHASNTNASAAPGP